jgi:hypothetical protein
VKTFKPAWDSRNILPETEKRTTETTTTSPVASRGGSGGAPGESEQLETAIVNRRCVSCATLLAPDHDVDHGLCVRCEKVVRGELATWCIACDRIPATAEHLCDTCADENEFFTALNAIDPGTPPASRPLAEDHPQ